MLDITALRQRQSDARARALAARQGKTELLDSLNRIGEEIVQADAEQEKASRQEKLAREEERRQERLRDAQRAYLEQQSSDGLDLSQFEDLAWYEGLHPYQLEGIEFGAAARRWVLGDQPGLGKTRQAIGWLDAIDAQKVILIAPGEVAEQFADELSKLGDHRTIFDFRSIAPAIRRTRQAKLLASDEGVAVLNYEAMRDATTGLMGDLLAWRADTLIADEAHTLRNTTTEAFKKVQKLLATDTYCAQCGREVPALVIQKYKPNGRKAGPAQLVPCPHCGWKKGQPCGVDFDRKIDEYLSTKSVKNVAFLTGTPLLNAPDELYALFHLARPDLFPNLRSFRETFTYSNAAGHRFFTVKGLENLREMIRPIYLARASEIAKLEDGRTLAETLPDREIIPVMVPIEMDDYPQQRTVIDQIKKFSQIQLQSGQILPIMEQLAQITRQRQANVFPGGIEVTSIDPETGDKVIVFTTREDIEEAAKMDELIVRAAQHADERQVVFSQFSTALVELEARLKGEGYRVVRLDGSTPKKLRSEIKSNFYRALGEAPRWDFVLVNYKTGGAGLNLTSCTVTHLLDSEWNPGNEEQSLHRTFRIGQTEETTVYRYLVPKSIDTRIESIKKRKRQLVEAFERGEIRHLDFDKKAEIEEALNAS